MLNKKILIVCPTVPYPENGAEQSDRANGIRQLIRLGFDVKVLAKRKKYQTDQDIKKFSESVSNVPIRTVFYKYINSENSLSQKIIIFLKKIFSLLYFDGAAFEYTDPEMKAILVDEIENWKPDIVWFEYTYLWPLYSIVKKYKLPIVTRSINFEPIHFLDEDGRSFFNYLKVIPKYFSEWRVTKVSDLVCAITPKEERIYKKMGAKMVITLPLRGISNLTEHIPRKEDSIVKGPINLFFMGSTYNVSHNKSAASFIIRDFAKSLLNSDKDRFHIYITGAKLPVDLEKDLLSNTTYMGFVQDIDKFLCDMDLAIIPSFFGAGMQQKIFEPLVRGIPTLASGRGLADYPFVNREDLLVSDSFKDFISNTLGIKDRYSDYINMGKSARRKSLKIFNKNDIDQRLFEALKSILLGR